MKVHKVTKIEGVRRGGALTMGFGADIGAMIFKPSFILIEDNLSILDWELFPSDLVTLGPQLSGRQPRRTYLAINACCS